MRRLFISTCMFALCGCAEFSEFAQPPRPKTVGEIFSGYNYVPVDPLPVLPYTDITTCKVPGAKVDPVLKDLPDNAVRIAVRQLSGSGSLGLGPAQIGVQGNSYQVILDYINADVTNIPFRYTGDDPIRGGIPTTLVRTDAKAAMAAPAGPSVPSGEFIVPVYVGIGLRLTANVTVRSGSVNLTSLGALSAAAQAQKISGSLVVQTLGITGKQVTTSLPLPSELNTTTIQNAILALGSVKAVVYDQPDTIITPRVTGIYNPLPQSDPARINMLVAALARSDILWEQHCSVEPVKAATAGAPVPKSATNTGAAQAATPTKTAPARLVKKATIKSGGKRTPKGRK